MEHIEVDLHQPPAERWQLSPAQRQQARELLQLYGRDLGLGRDGAAMLVDVAAQLLRADHRAELQGIADQLDLPLADVLLGNLYYDALKALLGCTAFAIDSGEAVLHARNLDWWTENDLLARYTAVVRCTGALAGDFTLIGWPGFAGVFSGVAAGRFAITLNAGLSGDPLQFGTPVVFLLRTVFETAPDFATAVQMLATTPIPCDCLLLLSGTEPGEMVVIERTPSRQALRRPQAGAVFVTNDYLALSHDAAAPSSALLATSCGRFDRIRALVAQERPRDAATCLRHLGDAAVRMSITVQQMVFEARTGRHWLGRV